VGRRESQSPAAAVAGDENAAAEGDAAVSQRRSHLGYHGAVTSSDRRWESWLRAEHGQ
jgi:hypothetical protein